VTMECAPYRTGFKPGQRAGLTSTQSMIKDTSLCF
jgi:hypothetical protein